MTATTPLPVGTVTFLFTDMQGSTPLWEREPEKMAEALQIHNALLRQAVEIHAGVVFKIVGDSFQVAFDTALQALEAAIQGQRLLQSATWNELGALKVRMGLHTGEAELDPNGDEYAVSHTKNRAARIMSAVHGGQIVVSQESADLVRRDLPDGVTLKDLGDHRLKGMLLPEHLFQVCAVGLPQNFPPLATLEVNRNNLPVQLSDFIGRQKEIKQLKGLLAQHRLVTLTGSGGVGKTRLGLVLAEEMIAEFPDGIWFVELATLSDPRQVALAVASALGIKEEAGLPILETLRYHFRERKCLVLLDNCEHLVDACTSLAENLLQSTRQLKILATSREPLGISGEGIFRVPSLAFPQDVQVDSVDQVEQFEAIRLFTNRAQAVLPEFTITLENASRVARICWRLDGIPLAIELAAARLASLDLAEIDARLQHSFRLLAGGSRTALERHRTLRATIDWSYNLLPEPMRLLLRRLSVFSGGFMLQAVEAICAGECLSGGGLERDEVVDLLAQLVNKSMVILERQPGREARYRMLEAIRQYASEKLHECGESEEMRNCHLSWYVQLAEMIGSNMQSGEHLVWTKKFSSEQENFFAAITWGLEQGADLQAGLRIIYALFNIYAERALYSDLQRWFEKALEEINQQKVIDQVSQVITLIYLGLLDAMFSKVESALARMEQALTICEKLEIDRRPIHAITFFNMGRLRALNLGELKEGLSLLNQAESLCREIGFQSQWILAWTLVFKSWTLQYLGELDAAQACAEESWHLTQSLGDVWSGAGLNVLGDIALERKDYAQASTHYQQWLELSQEAENIGIIPTIYRKLARVEKALGNYDRARLYLIKGLSIAEEHSDRLNLFHLFGECCFNEIAWARVLDPERAHSHLLFATHCLGKYQELMEELKIPVFTEHKQEYEQALTYLPEQLGQTMFETAINDGRYISVQELLKR
jgi:predicted ATPase/class 3 adenylate cyclase